MISFVVILFIICLLCNYEIHSINNVNAKILWHNLKFISTAVYILFPLMLLLVIVLLLFTNKLALRVEKLSIGGFSILFDNPAKLYKRQVKNFLDTKRTIFKIDLNNDNFKETFDSYYDIYKFFRDEIKVLGNINEKHFIDKETKSLYDLSNETIKVLNIFLTKHQSNYRRWYAYIEKTDEKKYYLTPIGELQKEYVGYNKLCSDFQEVNKFFVKRIATKFNIDMQKWSI